MSGFGKDQEMNEIKQLDKNYIAGTYGRFDLQITEGMAALPMTKTDGNISISAPALR